MTGTLPSIGKPRTSKTRPRVASPTGTVIGAPVSLDGAAAGKAVGRGHGDRPDPVVAEVLLDLADEGLLPVALEFDGVEDRRQLTGRELDVDDRAGDLDDAAEAGVLGVVGGRHVVGCLLFSAFSAPGRRLRSRSFRG